MKTDIPHYGYERKVNMENVNNIIYKKPLTVEEQTKYLAENKRVIYKKCSVNDAQEFLYMHNYINVISPFKYNFALKNKNDEPVKVDNKHVYTRDVDFTEYKEKYMAERSQYPALYSSIAAFETAFNAIVSNEVICYYNLDSIDQLERFINSLCQNIQKLTTKSTASRQHMLKAVQALRADFDKYDSIFILFDRMSLSVLETVYLSVDKELNEKIFNAMLSRNLVIGYIKKSDFDKMLTLLVQVRNCIMHGNSLTILIRYYDIKKKDLRRRSNKERYVTLIKNLMQSAQKRENPSISKH